MHAKKRNKIVTLICPSCGARDKLSDVTLDDGESQSNPSSGRDIREHE